MNKIHMSDNNGLSLDERVDLYTAGKTSFITGLLPQEALKFSPEKTLNILQRRFGTAVQTAIDEVNYQLQSTKNKPKTSISPISSQTSTEWIKSANIVGINLRTVGSFWGAVNYALTLPAAQNAIHLLPFWEPGVVGSLYGISSWELNEEFFSEDLQTTLPYLNTTSSQLKTVVNLLHLMGKTVGMDVVPHTDRFSEIVLLNPSFFEWVRRKRTKILDKHENLHEQVEQEILSFINEFGPIVKEIDTPAIGKQLFAPETPETKRRLILFGQPKDFSGRLKRRIALIKHLHAAGFETVPATMAPPYRGLQIDSSNKAFKIDENGLEWRDYKITEPQPMSRVFGPLTRYKLYERKDNNANWEIDFNKPRLQVWQYVCERYAAFQAEFDLDFMRGDMSHMQMREAGIPEKPDNFYDLHKAVKEYIQTKNNAPYFAYFAESFLAPPNVMGYGDEADHLEASNADIVLGDLQSTVVGSKEFLQVFQNYRDLKTERSFTPCFTIMTADKDDPRFDHFYHEGNELRMFLALFINDMPSYMGAGFEIRDVHSSPAPNEHYSKLYVFQEKSGPKSTKGPFIWGENRQLFSTITRMHLFYEDLANSISSLPLCWLIPPGPGNRILAWKYVLKDRQLIFTVNTDLQNSAAGVEIQISGEIEHGNLELLFSTAEKTSAPQENSTVLRTGTYGIALSAGEGKIYQLSNQVSNTSAPKVS